MIRGRRTADDDEAQQVDAEVNAGIGRTWTAKRRRASAATTLADLAALPRWVAWRSESRGGKSTKVPYAATGKKAKADDPATWRTRAEAEATATKVVNGQGSGGIGIELGDLGDDTHLAGIDLDSCLGENGQLAPWAAAILDLVPSYAELSPSGRGLKVFFYVASADVRPFLDRIDAQPQQWGLRRDAPGEDARDHGPAIEVYLSHGYFTVTGARWATAPDELTMLDRDALERLASLVPPARLGSDRRGEGGGDNSRSAAALRKGAALRREGKNFGEMCEALRGDPETAEWVREKGDAHGGRELHRIWDKAERRPNGRDREAGRRIELVPFDQMMPNLAEADLVAGLLGSSQLSALYGPPGCGKTFLILDGALRIATGKNWFRRRVKQGPVVYVAAEAGRRIFNRVAAWRSGHVRDDGRPDDDGRQVPFYVVPVQVNLCTSDDDLDQLIAAIRETCDAPVLIVIDTVSRVMVGGNENSAEDMGALIAACDRLRDEFGAHVCLIHHVGKDASRGARGHSSLHGAVDTAIEVSRNEGAEVSTARIVKQRDGEIGDKRHFVLNVVKIGRNEETGEDVTSCVVAAPDATQIAEATRAGCRLGKANEIALNALECVVETDGTAPPTAAGCPQERWVREEAWRARCYDDGISSGLPRAQQAAFRRAVEALLKEKLVGMQNGHVWLGAHWRTSA